MAGDLLRIEFSSPGHQTTTYMEMQDAHQPHFLMAQVANALEEHSDKWGPQYKRAFFLSDEDNALKELADENVHKALGPLVAEEFPVLKIFLREADGVASSSSGSQPVLFAAPAVPEPHREGVEEPTAASSTEERDSRFDILYTELQSGDVDMEFEFLLDEAKARPQEYYSRVQVYANHLAGGVACQIKYEDEDGDLCTMIEATSTDAIAHAKADPDDLWKHRLKVYLSMLKDQQSHTEEATAAGSPSHENEGSAASEASEVDAPAAASTTVAETIVAADADDVAEVEVQQPEPETSSAQDRKVLVVEMKFEDTSLDFEMNFDQALECPADYLQLAEIFATHLAGNVNYRMRYEDDEGDLCTLTQQTAADSLSLSKEEGGDLHLTLYLQKVSTPAEEVAKVEEVATEPETPAVEDITEEEPKAEPEAAAEEVSGNNSSFNDNIQDLQHQVEALQSTIERMQRQGEDQQLALMAKAEQCDKAEAWAEGLRMQVQDLCSTVEYLERKDEDSKVEVESLKSTVAYMERKDEDSKVEMEVLLSSVAHMQRKAEDLNNHVETLTNTVQYMQRKGEEQEKLYLEKYEQCDKAEERAEVLQHQLAMTKNRLAHAEGEASMLRAEITALHQERENSAHIRRQLAGRSQELAHLRRAMAARKDPGLAAQVIHSLPDAVGIDFEGTTNALSGLDVTPSFLDLKETVGASEVFRLGLIKARSISDELPIIYTVRMQNTGTKPWPPTAALVHHSGPVMDLAILSLTELPPKSCGDFFVELTVPKATTRQNMKSCWVLRDTATNQPLGPVLMMEVDVKPEGDHDDDDDEETEGKKKNASTFEDDDDDDDDDDVDEDKEGEFSDGWEMA